MSRLKSEDYKRKLDSEFQMAEEADVEDQAIYACYLCVRIGRYVEVSLKEIITSFLDNKSHRIANDYICNALKNVTNLNNEKIESVLASFSIKWRDYYKTNIQESMKSSLGSVYNLRNSIAHGRNAPVRLRELKTHYENIQQALRIVGEAVTK